MAHILYLSLLFTLVTMFGWLTIIMMIRTMLWGDFTNILWSVIFMFPTFTLVIFIKGLL